MSERAHVLRVVAPIQWPMSAHRPAAITIVAGLIASVGVGVLVVLGGVIPAAIAAALPICGVLAGRVLRAASRVPSTDRRVAVVWILLLASTLVWRPRGTAAAYENPLDSATLVRIAFLGLSELFALAVLLGYGGHPRRVPRSIHCFSGYVAAGAVAAATSPAPFFALFRVFELVGWLLAVLVALTLPSQPPGRTVLGLLVRGLCGLLMVVWIEAVAYPSRGFLLVGGVLSHELVGWIPDFSANTVGLLGGMLALLGMAWRVPGKRLFPPPRVAVVLGVITLVAAQYRTGIIAFVVAVMIILWQRRPMALLTVASVLVLAVAVFASWKTVVSRGEYAFQRGHPEAAGTLSNRLDFWRASIPFIRERPITGWGMNVGARRVLTSLGDNNAAGIHSTWVEALLGTGLVGACLLFLTFATVFRETWRMRSHQVGAPILGAFVFLCFRSVTGPTVELLGTESLLLAVVIVATHQLSDATRYEPASSRLRAPRLWPVVESP